MAKGANKPRKEAKKKKSDTPKAKKPKVKMPKAKKRRLAAANNGSPG